MNFGLIIQRCAQPHFALPSVRVQGCPMVSKCSNPRCSASFRYLRTGKLFRFDTPSGHEAGDWGGPKPVKRVEFFWLCEDCVTKFTLVTDAGLGARMVSLPQRARSAAAGL